MGGKRRSKSLRKSRGGENCYAPYSNYCDNQPGQCCNGGETRSTGQCAVGGKRRSKSLRKSRGGGNCVSYCGYCNNYHSQCGGGVHCYYPKSKFNNQKIQCASPYHHSDKQIGGVLPIISNSIVNEKNVKKYVELYNLKIRKISVESLHQCLTFYMNQLMEKLRKQKANPKNIVHIFKNIA